jgi:BirA family biotin operon repressor/biotin-[acetyl-CoA-carboxylase] ligase
VTPPPFISRSERFAAIPSTNDVVAGWLAADAAEVCLAVADEQTAGRGRMGRTWVAPPGTSLLASLGFRPAWIATDRTWRIAATVALAMADAAEDVAGLPDRTVRLKWPNDLVAADPEGGEGASRKLGGVLGESTALGADDACVVVGIGVNAGWQESGFPPDLAPTMTSLSVLGGGRPVVADDLLAAFLARLEPRIEALRDGRFDVADWTARQLVRRTRVRLVRGTDPAHGEDVTAIGVDPLTGALVVEDAAAPGGERQVHAGEILHMRAGV